MKTNLLVIAILIFFLASCEVKKSKNYKYPKELASYACYLQNRDIRQLEVEIFNTKLIVVTDLAGEKLQHEKFAILISPTPSDKYHIYSDISFYRLVDTFWTPIKSFTSRISAKCSYRIEWFNGLNCIILQEYFCDMYAFDKETKSIIRIKEDYFYNAKYNVKPYIYGFISIRDTFPQRINSLPIAFHVSEEYFHTDSMPPKLVQGDYKSLKGNLLINESIYFKDGSKKYDTITIDELEKARSIVSKWQE